MGVYDLWDIETGNMIGTFDSEAAALRVVAELLGTNGVGYAEALDLGRLDRQGNPIGTIATGQALVERLRSVPPALSRSGTATGR